MSAHEHPWYGKKIYMDFGDGVNGGESTGTITKVTNLPDGDVEVEFDSGSFTERLSEAIYIEIRGFGVIDPEDYRETTV